MTEASSHTQQMALLWEPLPRWRSELERRGTKSPRQPPKPMIHHKGPEQVRTPVPLRITEPGCTNYAFLWKLKTSSLHSTV